MSGKYESQERELKKNIEIVKEAFKKMNIDLVDVGVRYGEEYENIIHFYCEIRLTEDSSIVLFPHIKVNIYNSDGELIAMGKSKDSINSRYAIDTCDVEVERIGIYDDAVRAKIYLGTA